MSTNIERKEKFILQLDSSQLEEYLTCPLSWYYRYYENLRLSTKMRKAAVDKGTLMHKLLETFYKEMGKGNSRGQATRIAQDRFIKEDWAKEYGLQDQAEFLKKRFFQYQAFYDEDDFELLKNEKEEAGAEVGFAKILYEDEKVLYVVTGKIDGITQINNAKAWVDHKTQGRAQEYYSYCIQFLTYTWATGFEWGIINYIRMHEEFDPKKTFKKGLINFPKHLVDDWEAKMLGIFREITEVFLDPTLLFERFYAKRRLNSCAGAYKTNPCAYCNLCEIDPKEKRLLEIVKASNYTIVKPWSPWQIQEEEE